MQLKLKRSGYTRLEYSVLQRYSEQKYCRLVPIWTLGKEPHQGAMTLAKAGA